MVNFKKKDKKNESENAQNKVYEEEIDIYSLSDLSDNFEGNYSNATNSIDEECYNSDVGNKSHGECNITIFPVLPPQNNTHDGMKKNVNYKNKKKSIQNYADAIIQSKKAHIFHSIKILVPKCELDHSLNSTNEEKRDLLKPKESIETENSTRKDSTRTDKDSDEKKMILKNSIPNEIYEHERKEKCRNAMNNIYGNFAVYKNKIKKIEEKKRKAVSVRNKIFFVNNKLEQTININIPNDISDFHKCILQSINHFNSLSIRKAYYCLKEPFLKYSSNKILLKEFLENIFISEILFRYKTIKKMELIFNVKVENREEDFMKYSVIIKKLCKALLFDYIIDLKDVNGKVCFMKYIYWLQKRCENKKNIHLSTIEILDDFPSENFINKNYTVDLGGVKKEDSEIEQQLNFKHIKKNKYEESENGNMNENVDNNSLFDEALLEKKDSRKMFKKKSLSLQKNNDSLNCSNSLYKNSFIDFSYFDTALNENGQGVFYYITKNEFCLNKQLNISPKHTGISFKCKTDIKQKITLRDIITNKKTKKKKKGRCNKKVAHENNDVINIPTQKSDATTTIYYYMDLTVPSNFLNVVALLIEVDLFKHWIPYYNFPINFGILECKTLVNRGIVDKIIYAKLAMPWMIKDRYSIIDIWICEDFEFSKGIFIKAENFSKNIKHLYKLDLNKDNSVQLEMTVYLFIHPKTNTETNVRCHVEVSPNIKLNRGFASFLTKVFIKGCITHFIKACKEFETNEHFINILKKNEGFYKKLKEASEVHKIF